MKKILTISIFAVTMFAACKKHDYSKAEYYRVQYQTLNDTLRIKIKGSQTINPVNAATTWFSDESGVYVQNSVESHTDSTVTYKVDYSKAKMINLYFKKVNGDGIKMAFSKSDKLLNTTY